MKEYNAGLYEGRIQPAKQAQIMTAQAGFTRQEVKEKLAIRAALVRGIHDVVTAHRVTGISGCRMAGCPFSKYPRKAQLPACSWN